MRTQTLLTLTLTLAVVTAAGCRPSEAEVLDRASMVAADDDQSPRLRRVWAAAGDYATPSPDGRLAAFVDWSTGDVAVHDLATGQSRRITDKGTWTENGSWAEWPIFSPDGRKVVYSYGNVLAGDPFRYELRYVEMGDTTQHLLRAIGPAEDWIAPLDWSERGVLFTHYTTPDLSSLAIIEPESGTVTVLEPAFGRDRGVGREARFSPDARYVAYQMGGLKIRDLDAGTVASVDFPTTALIDWTADGQALVVHSVNDGRAGLWRVPVRDGRPAGEPRLIRDGVPSVNQGGGRAGDAFYYSIPADAPRVHLASLDVEGRRMLSAPVSLTTPLDGSAMFPAWSPDGRQLAYLLRPLNDQGPTRLMVRHLDGNGLRELATLRLKRITSLAWTPDSREILLLERDTRTLHGVAVADGELRTVLTEVGDAVALTPDGRTLIAGLDSRTDRDDAPAIVAVDLATGERRQLESLDRAAPRGISVSPDGRTIAYVMREEGQGGSEIRVLPVSGGSSRTAASVEFPAHFDARTMPLAWTPDGAHVLVPGGEWEKEDSHDLWAVSMDDGAVHPMNLAGFPGNSVYSLNPRGDRLAYIAGDARQELWMLDRIDP